MSNGLIEDVISVVRGEIESHNVVLRCERIHEALHVVAKRVQLQQVLINLVTNAIDAMLSIENGIAPLNVEIGEAALPALSR